jgi:hypothetical protein
MPRNQKATSDIAPGTADLGAAVLAGDAFLRHANEFIQFASGGLEAANNKAAANLGELIASATLLPLAIEIYLKALLLKHGKPAPKTHELATLFKNLPNDLQRSSIAKYEALRKVEGAGVATFEIQISSRRHTPKPNWRDDVSQNPTDYSLAAVLQRSSSAFVSWRYLFASNPQADTHAYSYEFLRLSFAAQCFRVQLGSPQSNKQAV